MHVACARVRSDAVRAACVRLGAMSAARADARAAQQQRKERGRCRR